MGCGVELYLGAQGETRTWRHWPCGWIRNQSPRLTWNLLMDNATQDLALSRQGMCMMSDEEQG